MPNIAEFIFQLLKEGRLQLTKPVNKTVTFHDPCYLGRHNGIFDQPREALKSIQGLQLKEMAESRMNSMCCGGGGGRIWMETPKSERFSDIRLKQAVDTGAEVIATCCPYCITNFEDSRLSLPDGSASIEVKDITEIIRDAL